MTKTLQKIFYNTECVSVFRNKSNPFHSSFILKLHCSSCQKWWKILFFFNKKGNLYFLVLSLNGFSNLTSFQWCF